MVDPLATACRWDMRSPSWKDPRKRVPVDEVRPRPHPYASSGSWFVVSRSFRTFKGSVEEVGTDFLKTSGVEQPGDEPRPAGLVHGAAAAPGLTAEVLVKGKQVVPGRIVESRVVPEERAVSAGIREKEIDEPPSDTLRRSGDEIRI